LDDRGKKTVDAIHQEITGEVNLLLQRFFCERRQSGRTDLEAWEMAVRNTVLQTGATVLRQVLRYEAPPAEQRKLPCSCGQTAVYRELRSRSLLTVVGETTLTRPWYLCPSCHQGQFPADREWDVEKTDFSPGVRRMLALVGQAAPFAQGREQMKLLAGLEVTTKAVERTTEAIGEEIVAREQKQIHQALQLDLPQVTLGDPIPILYVQMDGTGVPVTQAERREGKIKGQPAHTREVKLGCVFPQTLCDAEGYAVRDPDSTTFVGAIESATEFGKRLYLEAHHRGWNRARKKVVMGDGAEWIWNLTELHFPGAIQIVDLYHARQHLWNVARLLYPGDELGQKRWIMRHQPKLDEGKIEKLAGYLRSLHPPSPELVEIIGKEAEYFQRNAKRMRYPEFRQQHLFVGSGVIEAGCKTVIGSRLKQSGMFWTVRGANAIIALRCCRLNGRLESYWEDRRAA
jgi:hypothetical protein